MQLKTLIVVAAVAVVGVGATQGYRLYQRSTNGPFAIWSMNAGKSFPEMDADARRADGKNFTCEPLTGGARLCEFVSPGTGTTRAVVDSSQFTVVVQFLPDTETSQLRDEARQLSARWNQVHAAENWEPDASHGERSVAHWATPDGHWSATMRSGKFPSSPTSITTVDERRLADVINSDPVAFLQLAERHLLDRRTRADYDDAIKQIFRRREQEAPAASARAATLIAPAMALASCVRELSDTIESFDRWSRARAALGEETAATVERAVAVAHPGARLIVADRVIYVNPDGSAEAVRLTDVVRDGEQRLAFALHFVRRSDAAEHRLTDFEPANDCRAPAEIVVVSLGSKGAVTNARAVPIDEEALTSDVTRLSFAPAAPGEASGILVSYSASYATREWYGSVDWQALMDSETLRTVIRVPHVAGRKDASDREKAVILVASDTAPVGLHLTGLSEHDPVPTFLVLPAGPNGLASGWILLGML